MASVLLASLGFIWTTEVVIVLTAYALRRERKETRSERSD